MSISYLWGETFSCILKGGMEIHMIWRYTGHGDTTSMEIHYDTWLNNCQLWIYIRLIYSISLSFHQYNPHIVCLNICLMHIVNAVYPPVPGGRTGARCVNINRNRPQVIFRFTSIGYSLVDDQDSHSMNHHIRIRIPATATPQRHYKWLIQLILCVLCRLRIGLQSIHVYWGMSN